MDFSPTPKHLERIKQIMDVLVPGYLDKIPAEKLHEFTSICAQIHHLHWQMEAIDAAREVQAQEAARVDSPLARLKRIGDK